MTEAEKELWKKLRNRQLNGLKFHRQHPIYKFIADFYCHEKLLVIELDGGVHQKAEVSERDEGRQAELEKLGLRVIRFKNIDVLNNVDLVIKEISKHIS